MHCSASRFSVLHLIPLLRWYHLPEQLVWGARELLSLFLFPSRLFLPYFHCSLQKRMQLRGESATLPLLISSQKRFQGCNGNNALLDHYLILYGWGQQRVPLVPPHVARLTAHVMKVFSFVSVLCSLISLFFYKSIKLRKKTRPRQNELTAGFFCLLRCNSLAQVNFIFSRHF